MQLQPGRVYQRKDLHAYFGGQRQGGIVTPKAHPVILLFSSPKGEAYGYRDGWLKDLDRYLYSGEGTEGDMTLDRGNRAVLEHAAQGKQLLLFVREEERGPYLYVGEFAYTGHFWSWNTDVHGALRKVLTFVLEPINAVREGPETKFTPEQELLLQQGRLAGKPPCAKPSSSGMAEAPLWPNRPSPEPRGAVSFVVPRLPSWTSIRVVQICGSTTLSGPMPVQDPFFDESL
jgi:5-methylcytosine-specific restriction protein A